MLPDSIQLEQLAWGFLALPIVALYYWTVRRQREDVATFALWAKALARRSPWSNWRRLVSLVVQLVVLALLVVALAQLDWSQDARGIKTFVLIVDTSASMKATDVPPNRFGKAVAEARRAIAALGRDEKAAIISAGAVPQVHCRPIEDQEELGKVVEKLVCSDEPGELGPAVELAERMLEGAPNPRILVFTDGRAERAADLVAKPNLELRIVGGKPGNMAITRLVARASPIEGDHELLVEAANYSAAVATTRVDLSLGETKLETVTLEIPADGTASKVVSAKLAAGGLLWAKLAPGDDFPLDDVALALVAPHREPTCVLAGSDGTDLAAAIRAIPGLTVKDAGEPSGKLPEGDLFVFDGVVPREWPVGAALVFAPRAVCELWDFEKLEEGRIEVKSQIGGPPLAGIELADFVLEDLVRLKFKTPARTLAAAASGDPILTLIERSKGNVLVWHAPLDKCDFTQRAAFPLFVAQAIRLLMDDGPSESLAYHTGERIAPSSAGKDVAWASPADGGQTLPAKNGGQGPTEATAFLNEVGVWQLLNKEGGAAAAVAPANLVNAAESDLRAGLEPSGGSADPPRSWFNEPLWMAFLAGSLLLLLLDWFLLHRRTLV